MRENTCKSYMREILRCFKTTAALLLKVSTINQKAPVDSCCHQNLRTKSHMRVTHLWLYNFWPWMNLVYKCTCFWGMLYIATAVLSVWNATVSFHAFFFFKSLKIEQLYSLLFWRTRRKEVPNKEETRKVFICSSSLKHYSRHRLSG